MKKAISLISACVLILSLSACGSQPQESTIHSSKAVEADTLTTEQEPVQEELSGDKLTALFEEVYTSVHDIWGADTSNEERIKWEVKSLSLFIGDNQKLPEDYEALYKEWRAENITEDTQTTQQETEDFEEVSEIVYAISTVNIRSEASATSNKVGSLSQGNSITRVGIGQGEFTGWSKVKMSDGTIAYISSQYLTTTRPTSSTTQSTSKPSGGSSGSSSGSSTTPSQGQGQGGMPDFSDLPAPDPDIYKGGGYHDSTGYTTQEDELPPGWGFSG